MYKNNLKVVYQLLDDLTDHINYALFDIDTAKSQLTEKFAHFELAYIATRLRGARDAVDDLREGYEQMYHTPAESYKDQDSE